MARIRIEAPVRPTEDPDKVESAVKTIFPDARIERTDRWITATAESIDMLLKKAGDERVMDAARGALWRGRIDDRTTRFEINKQAAAVGRVNFNEVTHPLGDLIVTIEVDDLNALLDRISPPTAAELAHGRGGGAAAKRAELHKEEAAMEEIGSDIDAGFVDEEWDEGEWDTEDEEDEEDFDPLKRRTGREEE